MVTASHASSDAPTPMANTLLRLSGDALAEAAESGLKKKPQAMVVAAGSDGWSKYGCAAMIGIASCGESAPAPELFEHFFLTAQKVADTVRKGFVPELTQGVKA